MSTLTQDVQKTLKRNRWLTASQVAENVYGDAAAAPLAARRIRALRAEGVEIQTRQNGLEFQYRRR